MTHPKLSDGILRVNPTLKHITHRRADDSAKYMINYVPSGNRMVGLYRNDLTRSAPPSGTHKVEFSNSSSCLTKVNEGLISDIPCEDPRVFLYKNQPFGLFWTGMHQDFYIVDILNNDFQKINTSNIRPKGKNWTTIIIKGQLHIVYRVYPLIIYKYIEEVGSLELVHKIKHSGDDVRGGTSFVSHGGDWYGVAHKTHSPDHHTAVLIKISNDFTTIKQTPIQLTADPYKKGVFDPLSIYLDGATSELVFISHWSAKFVWHTDEFHTLECRVPLSLTSTL
tara:strand:+ start:126 stop:965 length:840 start_codon:yes stop_codon:yes gene_type:complete